MKLLCKYENNVTGNVLSFENFRIFSDLAGGGFAVEDGIDASKIDAGVRAEIIAKAEAILDKPYPQVLASDFIRFYRDGNRSIFENHYFERRYMLYRFAIAEAVEGKGRFLDRIMDGIWLVCDEADWVIHAHIPRQYALTPFWHDHTYIDLFSAETGSLLAWVYVLAGKALDTVTPQICERLLYCLHERITVPFLNEKMGWMGLSGNSVNNWNPWIISNVLTVCAFTERELSVREAVVAKALTCADNFIGGYHDDGGCDEGPSYWTAAGASLFDCLELFYDMTGGKVDIFGETLIRRMGEYEADFHICGKYFVNFADCPAEVSPGYRMIARYGRRTGSDRLFRFGAYYAKAFNQSATESRWELYRAVKNLYEALPDVNYLPAKQAWYNGICVMAEREFEQDDKGFFLACKGGHNAESHNHNDVGSFIVYKDGKPLIMDAGVGTYTKKTFSGDRYKIWSMCSDYHNLPTINGKTQLPGGQFRAKDVCYSADEHRLTLDISPAYPAEADLAALVRTASMQDGVITVTDAIKLNNPGTAAFTLMLGRKPELAGGVIDLGDCVIEYSSALTARLDDFDMDMEDDSIRKRWGGLQIYRVLLESADFTEGEFTLTVRKK